MVSSNRTEKFVFGLFLLFVITLTNSIFLCQIGYFGALLLLLIQFVREKKNPFVNSGLELPLLLIIIAEVFATIFSVDPGQALHTLVKRLMVIPIIYVTLYVAKSDKKGKQIVKVFLGAALLTASIYLLTSYEHLIAHLYSLEAKGPSTFQYVMTAGGLLSFVTIYFFAFFINEKGGILQRVLIGIALLIMLLALAGSYTRSAWIGAAAGIGTILLLKRKWLIILSGILIIIFYIVLNPKVSRIIEYQINGDYASKVNERNTEGRVKQVKWDRGNILVADYENGLLVLRENSVFAKYKTEKPIQTISKWKKNIYFSSTMNKTFYFFSIDSTFSINFLSEYIPPFTPKALLAADSLLFIIGTNGEFAEVTNPKNPTTKTLYHLGFDITSVTVERNFVAFFSGGEKKLVAESLKGGVPGKIIFEKNADFEQGRVSSSDSLLVFWTGKSFDAYKIMNNDVHIVKSPAGLSLLSGIEFTDFGFWGLNFKNELIKVKLENDKFNIKEKVHIPEKTSSFWVDGKKLVTGYSYKNRIASIIDPYHSTNVQRLNQWKTGWRIFKENPIFGVGDIDMNNIYKKYRAPYESETYGHLHNIYVHVLATLGGFGFIVFIFMLVKIFFLDLKIYNRVKNIDFISSFALGTLGSFVGFLVSGLAEWNFGDQEIATILWFTVGLNIAFYKIVKSKRSD